MGKRVVKRLLELKPDEGGYSILLHDIFVAAGCIEEGYEIRQRMSINTVRKVPG